MIESENNVAEDQFSSIISGRSLRKGSIAIVVGEHVRKGDYHS